MGNGQVDFEGEMMSIYDFEQQIHSVDFTDRAVVQFTTTEDVSVGNVTDVQKIMRDKGTLRIDYAAK